jgi:Spy/CpxP family protein refolding chaperone
MKTTTKLAAVALTVVSLAAASIVAAHPGGGYGMGGAPGMGPGVGMWGPGYAMGMGPGRGMGPGAAMGGMHGFDSPAVTAARLSDAKAALSITPAQESAWAAYEAQVRQLAETRQALHASMWAQMQDPKATIDHNAQHEAMTRLFALQAEARDALFAVLTPEQKSLFDQPFGPRGPGAGHPMWRQPQSR